MKPPPFQIGDRLYKRANYRESAIQTVMHVTPTGIAVLPDGTRINPDGTPRGYTSGSRRWQLATTEIEAEGRLGPSASTSRVSPPHCDPEAQPGAGHCHPRHPEGSQDAMKPLFIPLRAEHYAAFASSTKTTEYRRHGPGWNSKTCTIGRAVTLSHGYGKANRLSGRIVGFEVVRGVELDEATRAAVVDCYGTDLLALAAIRIELAPTPTEET